MKDDEILVVLSTFPDESTAVAAGRALVEESLAACAQVEAGALRSIYRWKGEIQDDRETLLRLKTTRSQRTHVMERLAALHPYEVPQIVAIEARANAPYARWLRQACGLEGPLQG